MNTTLNSTDPLPSASPEVSPAVYRVATVVASGLSITWLFYFVLTFPFGAVLLKYRTNYVPKASDVDVDGQLGEGHPHTQPAVNSYFKMFHRVLRDEKWRGLYKGFMPSVIKQFILLSVGVFVSLNQNFKGSSSARSVKNILMDWSLATLFSLPTRIVINRAVVTHHNLPWFRPFYSLRMLLTEEERRRPWILYLTPGLIATDFAFRICNYLLNRIVRVRLVVQKAGDPPVAFPQHRLVRICALLTCFLFTTTVECIYDVVFARLSVQCSRPASSTVVAEKPFQEKEADVVHDNHQPYTGLFDCVRRIKNEEGYSAFLRAWWYGFIPKLGLLFFA